MWRNDIRYKYMFMFPLKSLARKLNRKGFMIREQTSNASGAETGISQSNYDFTIAADDLAPLCRQGISNRGIDSAG